MKNITLTLVLSSLLILTSCLDKEGTVRVGSNMEAYALEYLENHEVLYQDEKILAYYDYTISLDGTTAAILTETRLIYHNQETVTSYLLLDEITQIDHYEKSIEGLIIEVWKGDELMVIEIAHWQNGDRFLNLLKKKTNL
tara:strand:+ start:35 stop:454 length:420 start_codon:yes stop_codon:yes gene_type:complete